MVALANSIRWENASEKEDTTVNIGLCDSAHPKSFAAEGFSSCLVLGDSRGMGA